MGKRAELWRGTREAGARGGGLAGLLVVVSGGNGWRGGSWSDKRPGFNTCK